MACQSVWCLSWSICMQSQVCLAAVMSATPAVCLRHTYRRHTFGASSLIPPDWSNATEVVVQLSILWCAVSMHGGCGCNKCMLCYLLSWLPTEGLYKHVCNKLLHLERLSIERFVPYSTHAAGTCSMLPGQCTCLCRMRVLKQLAS